MSLGFCDDSERRVGRSEESGVIDWDSLIGAKVRISSLTMQNGWMLKNPEKKEYTVGDIGFRITVDGKCRTIITLEEVEDRTFSLKDIEIISLKDEQDS